MSSRLRDLETSAKIKLALMSNPAVGGLDIGVRVVNGIVFLTGAVQGARQKALVEEVSRRHGALDVKNDVRVLEEEAAENPESPDQMPSEFMQGRMPSDSLSDGVIRDRIIGDLEADGRVSTLMLNLDVVGGIVRLYGVQDSEAARDRAERIAAGISGVREVINEIEVRRAA